LPLFGIGKNRDEIFWYSIIRKGLLDTFILKEIETYGLLKITEKGKAFLNKPYEIILSENKDYSNNESEDVLLSGPVGGTSLDDILLGLLKELRKEKARKLGLPPFVIFQDPSLEDMATQYPISFDELSRVQGVSIGKAKRYGKDFADLIKRYVDENEIERPDDFLLKTVINKSKHKVFIIQNIDRKKPLDEIAIAREIPIEDLLSEVESIVNAGTKLNMDYYINELLDEEQQGMIYDYFYEAETADLDLAYDELSDEGFERYEIQVYRIKFMSDLGN
jgi:ATP-dependent DNA helicase RecQ